jgi:uncharacterized protein involved in tolerance to divalent cations
MKNTEGIPIAHNNLEYLEAAQAELNRRNEEFFKSLSIEDQEKFNAVSQALKLLSSAGVKCFLFPYLPTPRDSYKESYYQYNNINEFLTWDNSLKLTKESKELLCKSNHSIITSLFQYARDMTKSDDPSVTLNFIHKISYDFARYMNHNEELSEIIKLNENLKE